MYVYIYIHMCICMYVYIYIYIYIYMCMCVCPRLLGRSDQSGQQGRNRWRPLPAHAAAALHKPDPQRTDKAASTLAERLEEGAALEAVEAAGPRRLARGGVNPSLHRPGPRLLCRGYTQLQRRTPHPASVVQELLGIGRSTRCLCACRWHL